MAAAVDAQGRNDPTFDSSKPFQGVVVCCTSVPPQQCTDIAAKTAELGGILKYDLTQDVTHLIVGDHNTPKYCHVAKDREDIAPMAAGWVDAVRDLWVADEPIDFRNLEEKWRLKPLETHGGELDHDGKSRPRGKLLCCLTGFDDPKLRQEIVDKIVANGGDYTGDLTRRVTHLIAFKAEGRKYEAAKGWQLKTVGIEWLNQSVERGMILDANLFDLSLPPERRGIGAWNQRQNSRASFGKRPRGNAEATEEVGQKKLRRIASVKLGNQREHLWGDILSNQPPASLMRAGPGPPFDDTTQLAPSRSLTRQHSEPLLISTGQDQARAATSVASSKWPFAGCAFTLQGFQERETGILTNAIQSMGGQIVPFANELKTDNITAKHFMVVPQQAHASAETDAAEKRSIVTDFFIEKCMYAKQVFDPELLVIGRPLPTFPMEGFKDLTICTAGFTDVDLRHVDKVVRQLGARYEERFSAQCSLLLCRTLAQVRQQKLDLAAHFKIPVVNFTWLEACIRSGEKLPFEDHLFPKLVHTNELEKGSARQAPVVKRAPQRTESAPLLKSSATAKVGIPALDKSAFDKGPVIGKEVPKSVSQETSSHTPSERQQSKPLSEKSASDLNKSLSPPKPLKSIRKPLQRVRSEVYDSELGGEWQEDGRAPSDLDRKRANSAAAAAHLALSARLSNLLEAATSNSHHGSMPQLARAATDSYDIRSYSARDVRPVRRKRCIIGRAVSNVSAGSIGSVESTLDTSGGSAPTAATTAAVSMSTTARFLDASQSNEPERPPSTQLEYDDPEAKRSKARMLSKMMGEDEDGSGAKALAAAEAVDARLTMRDIEEAQKVEAALTNGKGRNLRRR